MAEKLGNSWHRWASESNSRLAPNWMSALETSDVNLSPWYVVTRCQNQSAPLDWRKFTLQRPGSGEVRQSVLHPFQLPLDASWLSWAFLQWPGKKFLFFQKRWMHHYAPLVQQQILLTARTQRKAQPRSNRAYGMKWPSNSFSTQLRLSTFKFMVNSWRIISRSFRAMNRCSGKALGCLTTLKLSESKVRKSLTCQGPFPPPPPLCSTGSQFSQFSPWVRRECFDYSSVDVIQESRGVTHCIRGKDIYWARSTLQPSRETDISRTQKTNFLLRGNMLSVWEKIQIQRTGKGQYVLTLG
jgi:hypothetical protein